MADTKAVHLRLEPDVHSWAMRRAKLNGQSLNKEVSALLRLLYRNDSVLSVRLRFNPITRLYTLTSITNETFRAFSSESAARDWAHNAGLQREQIIDETEGAE